MGKTDIEWIVEKASELLEDKVREQPLEDEDVQLAFDIFAEPRLSKISDSFSDEEGYNEAAEKVKVRLHEVAQNLNEKYWEE